MASITSDIKIKVEQGLYNDLKKYAQNVAKGMAIEAKKILTEEAKTALDIYYGDYMPEYYIRTNNLHNNSFEPYYSNAHGSIYRGGVKFTSDNMGEVYNAPAEWIFSFAIGSGIHGLPGQGLPVTVPTPLDYVEKKRDALVGISSFLSGAGLEMARNDSYTYLNIN